MPQQLSPFLEGKYGWDLGEDGWNPGMDENLLKFSFMFDKNVDSIVASLPAAVNGQAHYLTTDNRLYFAVGGIYFSSPTPKWFVLTVRSTGQTWQYNGTSLVQIDTPSQLDTRLDAVELTVSTLGTAAFEDIAFFATQADLDVAEANAAAYTDDLRDDLAAVTGSSIVGFQQAGTGGVARTQADINAQLVSLADFATPEQATAAAYAAGACMHLKNGETAALVFNQPGGDDFKAMSEWLAASGHFKEGTARLYMQPTDVLHELSGTTQYVDLSGGKLLDIEGSATPTFLTITGISIAVVGGGVYTATVTTSAPLPAQVVVNYSLGCQNVQGDNGAESINGAHLVTSIAVDRLSFTFDYRSNGVVPTTATVIDTTTSLGLEGSRVVVPPFCFRLTATGSGWDGSAREGFINCFTGSKLILKHAGISYNGIADEHDILFAKDVGSQINLADRVVIAGTGDKVLRLAGSAEIYANRSCLGGGTTGAEAIQGIAGSAVNLLRCSIGGGTASALTPTAGCTFFASQCLITGYNQALRPTYPDASVNWANSRISHSSIAAHAVNGDILIDSNCVINKCTTPLTLAGGNIYGNPTLTANTNPVITSGQMVLGGAWYPTATNAVDPGFRKVLVASAALDFGSIAANSFLDLTIAATGAAIGDFVVINRASGTEPAQGITFRGFVSAADVVTVRAFNVTTGAIDPTAVTWKALVMRAT